MQKLNQVRNPAQIPLIRNPCLLEMVFFMSTNRKKNYYPERMEMKDSSSRKEEEENVLNREPLHVQGHRTSVIQRKEGDYMCPECSKTFDNKDRAEEHLHSEHFEHLRTVHGEFHSKDTNQQHQK
jgi:hypothetical protein